MPVRVHRVSRARGRSRFFFVQQVSLVPSEQEITWLPFRCSIFRPSFRPTVANRMHMQRFPRCKRKKTIRKEIVKEIQFDNPSLPVR
jgi:hypothetical protein